MMSVIYSPAYYAHVCMSKQLHAVAAWLARFGSGLFMVVQMIILLDMTQNWNDDWVSKEDERCVS